MSQTHEQRLLHNVGAPALAYLTFATVDAIRLRINNPTSNRLSGLQESVLLQLAALDSNPQFPAREWANRLGGLNPTSQVSVGNTLRGLAGGEICSPPDGLGQLEHLLALFVIDQYPAMLVKESNDDPVARLGFRPSLFRHPQNEHFRALALQDSDLKLLFTADSEHSGPEGSTMRSTGSGGGHQLWTLAETLVSFGWRRARLDAVAPPIEKVVEAALAGLSLVRSAIVKEDATTAARVGIAGVLLPHGVDELDFGWARLRKTDERDSIYVKTTSLEGQLATTTVDGEQVTIRYSGDLVLEFDIPYLVEIGDPTDPIGAEWPAHLLVGYERLEEYTQNVKLGLLLACPDLRAVLVSTWQVFIDPFALSDSTGWSDPRQASGLMPRQLSVDEAQLWEEWAKRVGERRVPSVGVAIRRMLMAVAERRIPEDILVDAVIVWENLFGAASETTLRVSSSLAWLLGGSKEERLEFQTEYKRIYTFRSRVVHGAAAVDRRSLHEQAAKAVQISIAALRAIFGERPELLEIHSSEMRSLHILHAGNENQG